MSAIEKPTITHGPILGRITANQVGVWARTEFPGNLFVRYAAAAPDGSPPATLDRSAGPLTTKIDRDNTGWLRLEGLAPNTVYFYKVVTDPDAAAGEADGSFRTLSRSQDFAHPQKNPRGLFNFAFEVGCCNSQKQGPADKQVELPTYATALRDHQREIAFAILNGDFIYEEYRDFGVGAWQQEQKLSDEAVPEILKIAPTLTGVWQNYKVYLSRSPALAAWHRNVSSFFVYDDHELVDDCVGAGSIGARPRAALFRDIGARAWLDYLAWSNPFASSQDIQFGTCTLRAGSNVLVDERANFGALNLYEAAELHVHWGTPEAGFKDKKFDDQSANPNAGVYSIEKVLDDHWLEIRPAARADGQASYSIGRLAYFDMTIANCQFVFLDTRGHRQLYASSQPRAPGISLIGSRQKEWLKQVLARGDSDCVFLVSSVNFMVPHVTDVGTSTEHQDSWTAYLDERDQILRLLDSLGKKVFILTGDVHNSFVIQITENVWEIASAPHNSGNAFAASEGGRPPNGPYDSFGTKTMIRWSTWFSGSKAASLDPQKVFCIVSVNNVFPDSESGKRRDWRAYPVPQVTFSFYDGIEGRLLYAESVLLNGK